MPVSLTVELITGSYDAHSAADRREPEWPPHPARLFCALVAARRGEDDQRALTWLEAQESPLVVAAPSPTAHQRSSYVVTNNVSAKAGSQAHPARTNALRTRVHVMPASPRVTFVWDQADAPDGIVAALDGMARRVPYLGRSTGVALVAASATSEPAGEALADLAVYEPCDLSDSDVTLRVPFSGYLRELDVLFEADRPSWEASRSRAYRIRRLSPAATPDDVVVPSVYTDVVVYRFAGLRPEGRLTPLFTEALRTAVLRQAGSHAPTALHGHNAPGRPHVAFLALPDVGHAHATGHLLGMAVAVPELADAERRAVLRSILGLRGTDGAVELRIPRIGGVQLSYEPGLVRPWGASPDRWRKGSRRWVSATPVVLDRYPKKPEQITAEVQRSCLAVGLPDPVDVQVSSEPLIGGAVRMRPNELPTQNRGRLFRHISLTFDRRVSGPVLLGAGRYLGVGLFAPANDVRQAGQELPA